MIYEITRGTIDGPGEFRREAMESAKESAQYLREKYPDKSTKLITSATGRMQRVAWLVMCESMDEAQAFGKQRSEDPGFRAVVENG